MPGLLALSKLAARQQHELTMRRKRKEEKKIPYSRLLQITFLIRNPNIYPACPVKLISILPGWNHEVNIPSGTNNKQYH
jgi:hypothetical protein